MNNIVHDSILKLQHTGRYMMEKNLAWGNAGNISVRSGDDECIITASGTYLGELAADDFVECKFGSDLSQYTKRPSKEMPMHSAIYQERPEINAVLHASPFYSTIVACSSIDLPSNLFVEAMYYLERVERVPYFHPGSIELGEAVRARAKNANILLLENHGVLVYDTNIKEARMALETLEMVSRLVVSSMDFGQQLQPLPKDTVQDFLEHSGYKPRRMWNHK